MLMYVRDVYTQCVSIVSAGMVIISQRKKPHFAVLTQKDARATARADDTFVTRLKQGIFMTSARETIEKIFSKKNFFQKK